MTCSCSPDKLECESENGSGQCTLGMTTNLIHHLGGDTMGMDSPICCSVQSITTSFRVVPYGGEDSGHILLDCLGQVAICHTYICF